MSEVVLTLPDNLVREAEANGLLKPESMAAMLRAEIRRRHVNDRYPVREFQRPLHTAVSIEEGNRVPSSNECGAVGEQGYRGWHVEAFDA